MSRNSSHAKSVLAILISTLVGVVLCAAIVELIPLSGKAPTKLEEGRNAAGHRYLDVCAHGSCAYPGVYYPREVVAKPGQPEEVIYDVTYTIDADRTRRTPSDLKPDAPSIPVNFFGGSFMFGEGLNDDQTLPYFFNQFIPDARVKNYGFHGHGVHNSLKLLDDLKTAPAQINVVLTGAYHARRASCDKDYSMPHPSYRVKPNGNRMTEYVSRCSERTPSDLAELNQTGFNTLYDTALSKLKLTKLLFNPVRDAYTQKQMALYAAVLHDFRTVSEERGITPVIMYLQEPWHRFLGQPSFADPMLEKLDKEHYLWVDVSLGENFRSVPREYYLHPLNKHPSALANCLRAKRLVDYLVRIHQVSQDRVNTAYACPNQEAR
ncbi:hypothetical protein UT4_18830 [Ferrigenium sp. UT4]